ncbi:cytochrome b [Marinagarivorans algicola]|uniref:cytochrome b n=1 Tax=Marinagarivorans algicola TaxID=1513270 RepID=UPI0006B689EF|nr:cytochrome b [Marinagarivorans algicola]
MLNNQPQPSHKAQLKNSTTHYGWLSRTIHWLSALAVIGLFVVGVWMVELDYYHEWYKTAPDLHRSFGVMLMLLTLVRMSWYAVSAKPLALAQHSRQEKVMAKVVHHAMLLVLFVMFVSGYLITTAQGDPLYVFNVLAIPATLSGITNLEDYAGEVHAIAGFSLIGLASVHALGALKHHFYDKDDTLKRMLGTNR